LCLPAVLWWSRRTDLHSLGRRFSTAP
jgi:hypothetical protein